MHFQQSSATRRRWNLLALASCFASVLLTSCHDRSVEKIGNSYAKPTAAEAFQLRSTCASLSEKFLKEKEDDLEPWVKSPNYAWWHNLTQVSRYNPDNNRCYIELTTETTSRTDSQYDAWTRELYDGQTKELLASTNKQTSTGTLLKKDDGGAIFVSTDPKYGSTFQGATHYIDDAMMDERKN